MNKVDWSKAPEGAERRSGVITHGFMRYHQHLFQYSKHGEWVTFEDQGHALEYWDHAVKRPEPALPNDIDTTITQRGERYGKFKDGSVIMQDLKNIMRETPNWEGLTPSQREALEMIQHKIGRILNGDPMYIDSWTDISGYSKLIADELNGAVR